MQEIWKDVVGYEGYYQVSNLGRVKSLERKVYHPKGDLTIKERILRQQPDGQNRYLHVTLSKNSKIKSKNVHRLILESFSGCCPEGMEACHIDGDCKNNKLNNLRWNTRKNNERDKISHGTYFNRSKSFVGENNPKAKLTKEDILEIRKLLNQGTACKEISHTYDIDYTYVYRIRNMDVWKEVIP